MKTNEKSSRFIHKPLPVIDIINDDTNEGRFYYRPSNPIVRLPSVTTLIGNSDQFDHSWLDKWKARVGEDRANQISEQSKIRGTKIHAICEHYLKNQDDYLKGAMPVHMADFKKLQSLLDKNVQDVYGIEFPLFSEKLGAAGRTDLIAAWNGTPAIIDFKTSKRPKTDSDIEHYFVQTTIYSLLLAHQNKMIVKKGVIIISVDHDDPQVFEVDLTMHLKKALKVLQ